LSKTKLNFTCSVCALHDAEPFLETFDRYSKPLNTFDLYRCSNCGLVTVYPLPDQNVRLNSISDRDINPFLYFQNSNKEILDGIYSFFHPYSVKWRINQIEKTIGTGRLLDVRCGNGMLLYELKQKLWEVTGAEPASKKTDFAKNTLGLNIQPNLESLLETHKDYFDIITFWHSFGSFIDLKKTIINASELLHPDGYLLLALPNWKSLDFWLYKKYWSALDVPRRIHHFGPRQVKLLLQKTGLSLEKTRVIPFDIYYNCLLSERIILGRKKVNRLTKLLFYWRSLTIAFIAHILSISGTGSGMLYFVRKRN
jgi:SAM-dependent methyltransferase